MTTKKTFSPARAWAALAMSVVALPALAVNDLPGGPKVNELDLQTPRQRQPKVALE